MNGLKLYRRRFIPHETILLKDDIVLLHNEEVILTRWKVLKPKQDFAFGFSCYFLRDGIKLSRMLDMNENIVYHYCDIINVIYEEAENSYIFEDLLVDIVVCNNGYVKVLDLAEIPDALDAGLIDSSAVGKALRIADSLLDKIYTGHFDELKSYIDLAENIYKG